jgi:hypothetical protein
MIRHLSAGFVLLAFVACKNEPKKEAEITPPAVTNEANMPPPAPIDSSNFTNIEWEAPQKDINGIREVEKDYGKIKEGDSLVVVFKFKNAGNKPLVIESAQPGCGCTVADYTKEPVNPGQTGEVKGVFDSNGKVGNQKKAITVKANTLGTQTHSLKFSVEVLKKG